VGRRAASLFFRDDDITNDRRRIRNIFPDYQEKEAEK
jgi:hypothetical protein